LDVLLIRLFLSFLLGGAWVTLITVATVRYGARLGGLLAGFPSTVAFSLIFIGWTESTQVAIEATTALPLALGFTATFPLVYSYITRWARLSVGLLGALVFWSVSSVAVTEAVVRGDVNFSMALVGFYAVCGVGYLLLARRKEPSVPSHGVKPTAFQWGWRFVLAGGIIVFAVFLSQTLGPLVGGVFASFPAIITSTIYITGTVEGVEATRGMALPVMLSTVFTIVPYIVTARYAFPLYGVFLGSAACYAVAIPLSVLAFYLSGRLAR
jgi:uncharacterized membrane protein (GlpM family)